MWHQWHHVTLYDTVWHCVKLCDTLWLWWSSDNADLVRRCIHLASINSQQELLTNDWAWRQWMPDSRILGGHFLQLPRKPRAWDGDPREEVPVGRWDKEAHSHLTSWSYGLTGLDAVIVKESDRSQVVSDRTHGIKWQDAVCDRT